MGAYYNEFDPKAAQWLRELIKGGHIADGDVDGRSITEVTRDDVKGYDQCHFFAGIGGWSLALRLAGWPDTGRNVWTGSPPCQPFSAAGQRKGAADARNLWPVYVRLIAECRPSALFGEQVAAAISNGWLDAVFADLESEGYACAATVLPACSVGAPHIRQRLWIVADAAAQRRDRRRTGEEGNEPGSQQRPERLCDAGIMADTNGGQSRHRELQRSGQHGQQPTDASIDGCGFSGSGSQQLADSISERHSDVQQGVNCDLRAGRNGGRTRPGLERGDTTSPWADLEWLACADGKARPTKPGIFPLAHGVPGRVGLLRGAGNAIVPQVAAQVIGAYMETQKD